ncbi:hypothetical protein Lupro_06090 [Lutibacter profundi]|uniref:Secretion system C-terminal sorting domain-containing protein n=2 Tax=Lutibacter profundi TaxID=1622118 RepID=A0A109RNF2_9FLAO|nr:hypothetical protein Lupro_06090 [Lutibacter profundi]
MPGNSGNNYAHPTLTQQNSWSGILANLFNQNYAKASDTANAIGYNLVKFVDTTGIENSTYYMLKTNSANYWGTYVYYPNYTKSLVIQSPHPKKDFNTGKEGVFVFMKTEALFFALSGTSRCNNSNYSSCDGTTTVCSGSSENYRISDLSHNVSTIFQTTTAVIFNTFNESHFIQLHGFSKLTSDPYIILSNGTQLTPSPDYISIFKTNIENEDAVLTFKLAHIDLSWTRLRGFYNTQGRLINASSNYCNANATVTNGRFMHLEQEKTRLRNDSTGWVKVANALNNTFSSSSLSSEEIAAKNKFNVYPNPGSNLVTIEADSIAIKEFKIYNMLGQELTSKIKIVNHTQHIITVNIENLLKGNYIFKIKTKSIKFKKY